MAVSTACADTCVVITVSLCAPADFMSNDCIILLSGGLVAVVFLVLALLVFMVCVCMLCRRWRGRAYSVPRDLDAYEMKRTDSSQASIRKDNGAVLTSSGANNFLSSNSYSKDLYPPSLPITAYRGSLLSDMQRSVTPPAPSPVLQTPGTGGTDSMFSSDDQSSLTASLPNFPRMQLQVPLIPAAQFVYSFVYLCICLCVCLFIHLFV